MTGAGIGLFSADLVSILVGCESAGGMVEAAGANANTQGYETYQFKINTCIVKGGSMLCHLTSLCRGFADVHIFNFADFKTVDIGRRLIVSSDFRTPRTALRPSIVQ